MERTSTDKPQQKGPPNIVTTNKAFKLAEQWVNNMTEAVDDEQTQVQGQPSRLGLGAKVSRQMKIVLNDPSERKLYAKITGRTRNSVVEEPVSNTRRNDSHGNDSDDSDDSESRTHAFDKKRAATNNVTTHQPKRKKW